MNYLDLPWVNLTPHPVTILDSNGKELKTWESKGSLRIVYGYDTLECGMLQSHIQSFSGPEDWEDYSHVIVSRAMAMGLWRQPVNPVVAYPDLEVRGDDNRIIGCKTLTRLMV